MEDFKNLKVWSKAHELTLVVYSRTRGFPRDEMYGLTCQIRRASASIGANIAEGLWSQVRSRDEKVRADRARFRK